MNNTCPPLSPISVLCCDSLTFVPISNLHIQKAVKRLRPFKSVGPDAVPGFIIKRYSTILVPVRE
jgi:hypothetical protein